MPPYPGFLIRVGERGDYVRQIQACLNRVNNAGLNEDGVFGPLTQAAVINYQRTNGLNPDGIVGPLTWNHLRNRCGGGSTVQATVQQLSENYQENYQENYKKETLNECSSSWQANQMPQFQMPQYQKNNVNHFLMILMLNQMRKNR